MEVPNCECMLPQVWLGWRMGFDTSSYRWVGDFWTHPPTHPPKKTKERHGRRAWSVRRAACGVRGALVDILPPLGYHPCFGCFGYFGALSLPQDFCDASSCPAPLRPWTAEDLGSADPEVPLYHNYTTVRVHSYTDILIYDRRRFGCGLLRTWARPIRRHH